jgi:DNA-binding Xre family transcriptional regulator
MSTLGQRINEMLTEQKLKSTQLADIAGCSKGLVTQWRDGTAKSISPIHAENIEKHTGYRKRMDHVGPHAQTP